MKSDGLLNFYFLILNLKKSPSAFETRWTFEFLILNFEFENHFFFFLLLISSLMLIALP